MGLEKGDFDEEAIINGILNNDRKIFEYLYRQMAPYIYQEVIQNSGTEEDAKDHFQNVIMVVAQNIKNNKYQTGNIEGYIKKIARNLWHKKLRKKRIEAPMVWDDQVQEADLNYEKYLQMLQYDRQITMVEKTLEQMANPCGKILKWHYYQKTPLKAIAEHFNWTYAYCKKKIYSCRRQMKTRLEETGIFNSKL